MFGTFLALGCLPKPKASQNYAKPFKSRLAALIETHSIAVWGLTSIAEPLGIGHATHAKSWFREVVSQFEFSRVR